MPRKTSKVIAAPQLDNADIPSVLQGISAYAEARLAFIEKQRDTGHWLAGNDNKVGAIAEFWVKLHYRQDGFVIDEIPVSNNAGWDFTASKNGNQWQVSVKAITKENKRGKQVALVKGKIDDPIEWEKVKWDEFALIILDAKLQPERIAICSKAEVQACHEDPSNEFNAHRAVNRIWLSTWMVRDRTRFPDVVKIKSWTGDGTR